MGSIRERQMRAAWVIYRTDLSHDKLAGEIFQLIELHSEYKDTPGLTNLYELDNYTLAVLIGILSPPPKAFPPIPGEETDG